MQIKGNRNVSQNNIKTKNFKKIKKYQNKTIKQIKNPEKNFPRGREEKKNKPVCTEKNKFSLCMLGDMTWMLQNPILSRTSEEIFWLFFLL